MKNYIYLFIKEILMNWIAIDRVNCDDDDDDADDERETS